MGHGIDQSVSPGIEGFILTFLLAAALWVLMNNMLPRLRNVRYREDAERAARGEADTDGNDAGPARPA